MVNIVTVEVAAVVKPKKVRGGDDDSGSNGSGGEAKTVKKEKGIFRLVWEDSTMV